MAQAIERGAVFCYPTDTIWGLGCHPLHAESIQRIQTIKRRSHHKGLILLSADLAWLSPYLDASAQKALARAIQTPQPRAVTWICKASAQCPASVTAGRDSIAVRITRHPAVASLSQRLRSPLISTSANISGRQPVRNSLLAHRHFHDKVDFIIEGFNSADQRPSQIRDIESGALLRA